MKRWLLTFAFILMSVKNTLAIEPIRYVALGDSYSIGTGAQSGQSWPAVVTQRLQAKGVPIKLVGNLSHSGWTSKNLIEKQLPALAKYRPNFVTVLIGTNDWIQGVPLSVFKKNFQYILTYLLKTVPAKNILVITVPDFSVAPAADHYANGRSISHGLAEINYIIIKEAKDRNVRVIDIFPYSQTMSDDLFSSDGLHPSGKGYARWADLIEKSFLPQ